MRYTLATFLFVMLVVALAVGWWIDSTRSQKEILSLRLRCQLIETLQFELRLVENEIFGMEMDIKSLKRLNSRAGGENDRLRYLVKTQCLKSTRQLQALSVHKRFDELMGSQIAIPKHHEIGLLKIEIRECKQMLANVERQSTLSPEHALMLRNQIATLETVTKKIEQ